MSDTNGHGQSGIGAAIAPVGPVMLVRYRAGVTGHTAHPVHLVPMPDQRVTGAVGTLCGALLDLEKIEVLSSSQGMPCTMCLLTQLNATTRAGQAPMGSSENRGAEHRNEGTYQAWGWPVTQHRDQIRLNLNRDVSAIAIPTLLSTELTQLLTTRHCAPAVLAHPYAPEHHIVLTGERYGGSLPWPPKVHHLTGTLMLPPTTTHRGPITWIQPPRQHSLRLTREIDVFGALRTILSNPPLDRLNITFV
ncbi:MAG TPA: hypothetical protein VF788_15695 [Pseudonocardiaceae bacterium]